MRRAELSCSVKMPLCQIGKAENNPRNQDDLPILRRRPLLGYLANKNQTNHKSPLTSGVLCMPILEGIFSLAIVLSQQKTAPAQKHGAG